MDLLEEDGIIGGRPEKLVEVVGTFGGLAYYCCWYFTFGFAC